MGLDMYLYGVKEKFNEHDYNIGEVKECIEIGYWRKANAIHKWFVDNCQDCVDNCAIYYVDPKKLEELREICKEVLKDSSKASELLQTKSGFFLGSTEYDEWYFDDLKETIQIIDWA